MHRSLLVSVGTHYIVLLKCYRKLHVIHTYSLRSYRRGNAGKLNYLTLQVHFYYMGNELLSFLSNNLPTSFNFNISNRAEYQDNTKLEC